MAGREYVKEHLPKLAPSPSEDIDLAWGITTTETIIESMNITTTTIADDTVHYLSPKSQISARTVNEGDIDAYYYVSPEFMQVLQSYDQVSDNISTTSSSIISCKEPQLQRTLAIIKPEAMMYKDVILRAINEAGLKIIRARHIHLTPEQVCELYAQHYDTKAFPNMVVSVSIGPMLSLCLAAINAVAKWRNMVGPDRVLRAEWFLPISMRSRFGLHGNMLDLVHASETCSDANIENRYFNPESTLDPIIDDEVKVWDYCTLYVNKTLRKGLSEVVKAKPVDPIIFLAEWLSRNDPYTPKFPPDLELLPT